MISRCRQFFELGRIRFIFLAMNPTNRRTCMWTMTSGARSSGLIQLRSPGTLASAPTNSGQSKELWKTTTNFCYLPGMGISGLRADERVKDVSVSMELVSVGLEDGRTISAPLAWFPRLLRAKPAQRSNWRRCAAGYGIYWPEIDEHLSVEGLLRGAPSPELKRSEQIGSSEPRGSVSVPSRASVARGR